MKQKFALHLFLHVSKLIESLVRESLGTINVSHGQGRILLALHSLGAQSISSIAENLSIESPTVTIMIKKMEEAGLVTRQRSSGDERVKTVVLTAAGSVKAAAVHKIWALADARLTQSLSKCEVQEIHSILLKVRNSLGGRSPLSNKKDEREIQ